MKQIAAILGQSAVECEPKIAVVCCNGSCDKRKPINTYDGPGNCAVVSALYGGETACSYGCLGLGDCVTACLFGGVRINPETGLPEIDETLCNACGSCVKVCPKQLIQLRKKGADSHRIYVACMNKDKGAVAKRACSAACTACLRCQKICESEAIIIADNLAFIDDSKCTLCGKCVKECTTSAIVEHLKTETVL
jgi:ferredoxin